MFEQLAQRGAPDVTNLIEHDGEIIWPTRRVQVDVFNAQPGAIAFVEVPDTVALDAWLRRDALIAALDAFVDEASDDAAALTHEARELRTDEVLRDLLAVERDESALVWLTQSQNLPVEHRADINPVGCRVDYGDQRPHRTDIMDARLRHRAAMNTDAHPSPASCQL